MQLCAHQLSLGYGNRLVVEGIDLEIDPRQITVIIGPNGSGKSTLLTALAGQLSPRAGDVTLEGRSVSAWQRGQLARALALLPQQPRAPEEILVRQMVAHGRFAHRRTFRPLSRQDRFHIDQALERTDTAEYADRLVSALSGGQRQRVWIAMALAQTPGILLLDEPTSFLDVGFQYQVLDLLTRLNRDEGLGIVMVLHDINQASFYADRIIALEAGRIVADGNPHDIMTSDTVSRLYCLKMRRYRSQMQGRPYCLPAQL